MVEPSVQIMGIDEFVAKLQAFPNELRTAVERAGDEGAKIVLGTEGVQKYPSETAANQPPMPFYQRGVGTQYVSYNDQRSERYHLKFNVRAQGYKTVIGNTASYAPFLGEPEKQATRQAQKGWRILFDVANEKIGEISKVYEGWLDRALRRVGLK